MNSHLAANLRRLREAAGLTQHSLAEVSGISRSTIAAIEGSKYEGAELATILALAEALKTTVSGLVERCATAESAQS